VIFLDANVPMYLVGADHPHKLEAQDLLGRLVRERRRLATSSEVFQEILYRYTAADRRERIEPAFAALSELADDILPIGAAEVFAAKELVHVHPDLSARDALHVAVMRAHGIGQVVSFDRRFGAVSGIERLPPGR
jgi:predicted nucleic acid-binding protein